MTRGTGQRQEGRRQPPTLGWDLASERLQSLSIRAPGWLVCLKCHLERC